MASQSPRNTAARSRAETLRIVGSTACTAASSALPRAAGSSAQSPGVARRNPFARLDYARRGTSRPLVKLMLRSS